MDTPDTPGTQKVQPKLPYQYVCEFCTSISSATVVALDELTMRFTCLECMSNIYPTANHFETDYSADPRINTKCWEVGYIDPTEPDGSPHAPPKNKEYWYFLTWTLADNHTIEEVRENIDRLIKRKAYKGLQLFYADCVLEHGSANDREHYHMRIKTRVPVRLKGILQKYQKYGFVHSKPIVPQTEENWLLPSGKDKKPYMEKEGCPIVVLLDE